MKKVAHELTSIVSEFAEKLNSFSEKEFAEKPNAEKWSKKEIVGHLIDSGQNNLRRFIVCQYESSPPKIVYDQDFWVQANNYQSMTGGDVIALWILVNKQIANVLTSMDPKNYSKLCDSNRYETKMNTLEWLAIDYVKHLKHHLNQVIEKSFDVVYP